MVFTVVLLFISGNVSATTITFDDLGGTSGTMPSPYEGLSWDSLSHWTGETAEAGSGYKTGLVSTPKMIFSTGGTNGNYCSVSIASDTFDFTGVYLTSAWRNGMSVTIKGYENGLEEYSTEHVLNVTGPTWLQLEYFGIDQVTFSSSGGTVPEYLHGFGSNMVMDNFTINESVVPLPATVWFLGLGLIGLVGFRTNLKK